MSRKILVVDDNPDILKALSIRLRAAGYEVISAVDGVQALRKAHNERPDVVILDMMIPAGDGFTVLDKLALSADTLLMPVIILTASPRFEIEDETLARGARYFLRKPYQPEELMRCVKDCLGESPDPVPSGKR